MARRSRPRSRSKRAAPPRDASRGRGLAVLCRCRRGAWCGHRSRGVVVAHRARPRWPRRRPAAYVGGQACAGCHRQQYEAWKTSDHALAMQPADGKTVLGNFDHARFTKDGVTTTFFMRDGQYWVRTDGPDGALHDYRIAYTFGVEPLQQYLIEFPADVSGPRHRLGQPPGRLGRSALVPSVSGGTDPPRRPPALDGPSQNWNYMCADCHSTNLQKNYRLAEDRFDTTWTDLSVSCEACHGPGSRHVAWAQPSAAGRASGDPARGLVVDLRDTPAIAGPSPRASSSPDEPSPWHRAPAWRRVGDVTHGAHRSAAMSCPGSPWSRPIA